jgi:hypothetical protein
VADVLELLAAAVLVMGGAVVLAAIKHAVRSKVARLRREAPRQLRKTLLDTDAYIEQVNDVLSEDDLDSLEDNHRKREH